MKILVFTEGTIIMHQNAKGCSRKEIIKQVKNKEKSIYDYNSYISVGNAVKKLQSWAEKGAEILYLTSRTRKKEIDEIKKVLKENGFPKGELFFRKKNEEYKDVAERVMPDILIEDDCESIGGVSEMTITHLKPKIKEQIKSIPIKEFGGIDHLSEDFHKL